MATAFLLAVALLLVACSDDDDGGGGISGPDVSDGSGEFADLDEEELRLEELLVGQQLEAVESEAERSDAEAAALRDVADRKAAEVAELEQQVDDANADVEADQEEVDKLEAELAAAKQEAEELEDEARQAEAKAEQLAEERAALEERRDRLTEHLNEVAKGGQSKQEDDCKEKASTSTSTTALAFNDCDELATGAIPQGAIGSGAPGCGGGGGGTGPGPAGDDPSFVISNVVGLDGYVSICGGPGNPTGLDLDRLAEQLPGAFYEPIDLESGEEIFVLILPVEHTAEVFELANQNEVLIVPGAGLGVAEDQAVLTDFLQAEPEAAAERLNDNGFGGLEQSTIEALPLDAKLAFKPSLVTQLTSEDFGEFGEAALIAGFDEASLGALHALDEGIVDIAIQADPALQAGLSTEQLVAAGIPVPDVPVDDTTVETSVTTNDTTDTTSTDSTTTDTSDSDSTTTTEEPDTTTSGGEPDSTTTTGEQDTTANPETTTTTSEPDTTTPPTTGGSDG